MDEKRRKIQTYCKTIGEASLLICIILTVLDTVLGNNTIVLFALRILFAGIALITYEIIIEIKMSSDNSSNNEDYISSALGIVAAWYIIELAVKNF